MKKDVVQLLAAYNMKVNQDMNVFLSKLTADQWNHQFGGYYKSISSLANHLYIADFNWLKRFAKLRHFLFLDDPSFTVDFALGSAAFSSIEEYLDKRKRLDHFFLRFAEEVKDDDMEKKLIYKNFKGIEQTKNFGGTILHVFNHQTHHRGMISLYLDSLGIDNDYSNLISMV